MAAIESMREIRDVFGKELLLGYMQTFKEHLFSGVDFDELYSSILLAKLFCTQCNERLAKAFALEYPLFFTGGHGEFVSSLIELCGAAREQTALQPNWEINLSESQLF